MKFAALALLGCLAAAPLAAQQPAVSRAPTPGSAPAQSMTAGPRLEPQFQSYRPTVNHREEAVAAAADKTTITISTLGLVLIAVLLILLLT